MQDALEGGAAEEQKKAAALEASLAQAQAALSEVQSEKQALNQRLEQQQENLYEQVSTILLSLRMRTNRNLIPSRPLQVPPAAHMYLPKSTGGPQASRGVKEDLKPGL